MKRHLLLTVGDDLNSLYGVRFAASFFRNKADTHLTLFYVAPRFDAMDIREAGLQHQMDRKMAELYREKGQNALDVSLRFLCDHGFLRDNLATKLIFKRHGTVKDIIEEGRAGFYDAVVLGRRGYTLFEGSLVNSVSREVLDRDIDFPLWVCRRPEMGRKNVLLCVDETEPSLRIADHVGFVLNREEDHAITLFHVDAGEGKNVDAILDQARFHLTENGIPAERIKTLVKRHNKVVKAILDEVERGAYAAVAVGRGGAQPKGIFKKWLLGSRSTNLLEILDKAALWVSK
jgi:nucleotide-binding universal stress UspA family protein